MNSLKKGMITKIILYDIKCSWIIKERLITFLKSKFYL